VAGLRVRHSGAEATRVDRAVLVFPKSEVLHPADFTIREDGVVRLNPELARRVASFNSNLTLITLSYRRTYNALPQFPRMNVRSS
jgi:hypothetical protein